MSVNGKSWEGERKEARENNVEATQYHGEGNQGLRFKIMGVQNSGEESRLERGYRTRTKG